MSKKYFPKSSVIAMQTKGLVLLLALIAASSCAPSMMQRAVVYQLENDISMKNTWKEFLLQNPTPKIVLRVPGISKEIAQSEMALYESLYNDIERSLLQGQFTVRDRALLKEVLTRAGGELSYSEIGKKVDTDLILEIVSFRTGTMAGSSYNERTPDQVSPVDVFGAVLEGRIIMVSSGEIVGMFSLKELHPHPEFWILPPGSRTYSVELTESDIAAMKSAISRKLIDLLKGRDVPNSTLTWTPNINPKGRLGPGINAW